MHVYSYIAGGGIGNRSAAICAYLSDLSINPSVRLVWESLGGSMANSLPQTLWENWDLHYTTTPQTDINTIQWYIPARAVKSFYVKKWWSNLRPVEFIRTNIDNSPSRYDAAVTIRNIGCSVATIDINSLLSQLNKNGVKNVFVSSDRYSTSTFIFDQLSSNGFSPFMYKESVRLNRYDSEAGSHEHNLWSLVDWYSLLKCSAIYKNDPISTFTDFAEYMKNIPTNIIT